MRAVPATKLSICGTRGDANHGSGNSGLAQQLNNADKGMRVAVFAPHVADPLDDPEVRPAAVRPVGAHPVPPVGAVGGSLIESAAAGAGQHAARHRRPESDTQQCAGT